MTNEAPETVNSTLGGVRGAFCLHDPDALMRVCVSCLMLLSAGSSFAQGYSVDWHTIDGGGGVSTGGVYSVTGSLGQPDAGRSSGSDFVVQGGFWGIIAVVQTPGAPLLRIQLTATNSAIVAWPNPSTGFVLQENPSVGTTNWTAVTNIVNVVADEKQVALSPPAGNRFYRLFRP